MTGPNEANRLPMNAAHSMSDLKKLLGERDVRFWNELNARTQKSETFGELIALSNLRKRADAILRPAPEAGDAAVKIAIVGGSTLYPLSELIEHVVSTGVGPAKVMTGEFDNFRSELLEGSEEIDGFGPSVIIVIPDEKSCRYSGRLSDSREDVEREAARISTELLHLCETAHARYRAAIVLCNYLPSPLHDLGQVGTKAPASDWNFKRAVNLALASGAPNYIHICDLDLLAYRLGGLAAREDRSWFESKQPFSPAMLVSIAREAAHIIASIKSAPKKVLVLDLDNTLWGGIIGDDGMEGIEIGDTSPRGEAFKAFQAYIRSLMDRGLLLGVCSKNDHDNAIEPFRTHPEMVLREADFVSFKANWEPKAANLIEMAAELSLGLDSFVFVDDNPAEIEIVNQFAPDVTTILLSDDPSGYVRQLQESRLFERTAITSEDADRTEQYRREADRRNLEKVAVDMDSYLDSLGMTATVRDFNRLDLPRVAQLINKSNQFNLTTRRRSEAEVAALMNDPDHFGFTFRLADRFGDHGLISVVICRVDSADVVEIDTWLMSCRVLKRQVEHEVLNEIARRAIELGRSIIRGRYLPTAKNGMIRDLLPGLGFTAITSDAEGPEFELDVHDFERIQTFINVTIDNVYDASETRRDIGSVAVSI